MLNAYFKSDKPQQQGLPTVAYCADQLNLSPNYFGDLIKKETGKSALEYIQTKVMDMAKEKIFAPKHDMEKVCFGAVVIGARRRCFSR